MGCGFLYTALWIILIVWIFVLATHCRLPKSHTKLFFLIGGCILNPKVQNAFSKLDPKVQIIIPQDLESHWSFIVLWIAFSTLKPETHFASHLSKAMLVIHQGWSNPLQFVESVYCYYSPKPKSPTCRPLSTQGLAHTRWMTHHMEWKF